MTTDRNYLSWHVSRQTTLLWHIKRQKLYGMTCKQTEMKCHNVTIDREDLSWQQTEMICHDILKENRNYLSRHVNIENWFMTWQQTEIICQNMSTERNYLSWHVNRQKSTDRNDFSCHENRNVIKKKKKKTDRKVVLTCQQTVMICHEGKNWFTTCQQADIICCDMSNGRNDFSYHDNRQKWNVMTWQLTEKICFVLATDRNDLSWHLKEKQKLFVKTCQQTELICNRQKLFVKTCQQTEIVCHDRSDLTWLGNRQKWFVMTYKWKTKIICQDMSTDRNDLSCHDNRNVMTTDRNSSSWQQAYMIVMSWQQTEMKCHTTYRKKLSWYVNRHTWFDMPWQQTKDLSWLINRRECFVKTWQQTELIYHDMSTSGHHLFSHVKRQKWFVMSWQQTEMKCLDMSTDWNVMTWHQTEKICLDLHCISRQKWFVMTCQQAEMICHDMSTVFFFFFFLYEACSRSSWKSAAV